jgi:hypothetical protein
MFTGDTGTDDDDRGARSRIHERNGMNVCFCVRVREREREREGGGGRRSGFCWRERQNSGSPFI